MSRAEAAVAIARRWIGTPYLHQGSREGVGADCLGLLRGIWRELYGCEPEPLPPYSGDWSEPAREERLWRAVARHMRALPEGVAEAPGDVVLMRMREGAVAKHLGVVSRVGASSAFIHAYTGHGVLESPLALPWRRRIAARFQFP